MNTAFANSQNIQGGLNAQLQTLTNQGMAGKGFVNGQEANLRADSTERAAQSNVSAEQALNARNAGGEEGGAATSGGVAAGSETLASNAAEANANAQRNITNENATLARSNVQEGLSGLGGLSGQETGQADALTSDATSANENSFKNQTQAYQPSTFWSGLGTSVLGMGLNAIAPGVGTLATGILGGLNRGSSGSGSSDQPYGPNSD